MEAGYVTALAALVGSLFGSLTSLATTWFSQRSQRQAEKVTREVKRREELYGAFLDEAARLCGQAMRSDDDDPAMLVALIGMMNRMRLFSGPAVLAAAERVLHTILALIAAPSHTLRSTDEAEARKVMEPLADFADVCRRELDAIGSS